MWRGGDDEEAGRAGAIDLLVSTVSAVDRRSREIAQRRSPVLMLEWHSQLFSRQALVQHAGWELHEEEQKDWSICLHDVGGICRGLGFLSPVEAHG